MLIFFWHEIFNIQNTFFKNFQLFKKKKVLPLKGSFSKYNTPQITLNIISVDYLFNLLNFF